MLAQGLSDILIGLCRCARLSLALPVVFLKLIMSLSSIGEAQSRPDAAESQAQCLQRVDSILAGSPGSVLGGVIAASRAPQREMKTQRFEDCYVYSVVAMLEDRLAASGEPVGISEEYGGALWAFSRSGFVDRRLWSRLAQEMLNEDAALESFAAVGQRVQERAMSFGNDARIAHFLLAHSPELLLEVEFTQEQADRFWSLVRMRLESALDANAGFFRKALHELGGNGAGSMARRAQVMQLLLERVMDEGFRLRMEGELHRIRGTRIADRAASPERQRQASRLASLAQSTLKSKNGDDVLAETLARASRHRQERRARGEAPISAAAWDAEIHFFLARESCARASVGMARWIGQRLCKGSGVSVALPMAGALLEGNKESAEALTAVLGAGPVLAGSFAHVPGEAAGLRAWFPEDKTSPYWHAAFAEALVLRGGQAYLRLRNSWGPRSSVYLPFPREACRVWGAMALE